MIAAMGGHVAVAKALLEAGAAFDFKDYVSLSIRLFLMLI